MTPDQQDGVGENLLLLQKNLFFQTLCRQAGKTALYPECPAAKKKIADYFGITVEELMGTKKEPAGMGELDKQMQEIVELLFVVSIILCYNSYKLKSRGKRNIE